MVHDIVRVGILDGFLMGERLSPYSLYMAEDTSEDVPEIDKDPQEVFEQAEIEGRILGEEKRLREERENQRRQYLRTKLNNGQLNSTEEDALDFFKRRNLGEKEAIQFLNHSKLASRLDLPFKEALVQEFCDRYTLRNYYTNPFVPELKADQLIEKLKEHQPARKAA